MLTNHVSPFLPGRQYRGGDFKCRRLMQNARRHLEGISGIAIVLVKKRKSAVLLL